MHEKSDEHLAYFLGHQTYCLNWRGTFLWLKQQDALRQTLLMSWEHKLFLLRVGCMGVWFCFFSSGILFYILNSQFWGKWMLTLQNQIREGVRENAFTIRKSHGGRGGLFSFKFVNPISNEQENMIFLPHSLVISLWETSWPSEHEKLGSVCNSVLWWGSRRGCELKEQISSYDWLSESCQELLCLVDKTGLSHGKISSQDPVLDRVLLTTMGKAKCNNWCNSQENVVCLLALCTTAQPHVSAIAAGAQPWRPPVLLPLMPQKLVGSSQEALTTSQHWAVT